MKHRSNIFTASQYFLKEGPLAILPLSKKKFSLIWSINSNFNLENIERTLKNKLKVIEAIPPVVKFTSIDSFFSKSDKIIVGRLKPEYKYSLDDAVNYLKKKINV